MGATETARRFKADYSLPFTVLVDKKRESYRMLGLKRASFSDAMSPRLWVRGAKSVLKHGQGIPKEDPAQLGGAAVVRDGKLVLVHRSENPSDNLSIDELVEAL